VDERTIRVATASRRRLVALGVLVAASVFALALLVLRFELSGTMQYWALAWNLLLAWVPLGLALLAYDRRNGRFALLAVLALWLAFLPNAPYLVTDFVHLRDATTMPVWFDVALLTSFAWTGLLLGFVSVYLVQAVVRHRAGPVAGWASVLVAFGACGVGIYVGRYLRLNTWDLLVRPTGVLGDVAGRIDSPRLVGMSLVMTAFLTIAYAMLYTVMRAASDERP
jgi:uncharacterized membrane protein